MNKYFLLALLLVGLTHLAFSQPEANTWKEKPDEKFSSAEENFKITMQNLLEKHVDKTITKEELYRAATAGMLASLNPGEESWNELLSPENVRQLQVDLSGKVTGIGIELKFDETTGYGLVLRVIPGSVAERAGVKGDDQILSVDGKKFKGKKFLDMVYSVRGEVGKAVSLKILREDKVLSFSIKRENVAWTPVDLEEINDSTALLTVHFFNQETPTSVEKRILEVNNRKYKKLIVDVRNNSGGGFDQAVQVTELFVPKEAIITNTKSRNGGIETIKSRKGILDPQVQVVVITNKKTYSGAELFTAALKESRNVKTVGETTYGKWSAQTIEPLPNKFAIKYTVKEFQSPNGNSFQGKGIKPDIEIALPTGVDSQELRQRFDVKKRLGLDNQLKAAVVLFQAI